MLVRPKNVYNVGSSSMTKSFEGGRGRRKKPAQTLCAVGMNLNKRKESKAGEKAGGRRRGVPTAPLMSSHARRWISGTIFISNSYQSPLSPRDIPGLLCSAFCAALPQVSACSVPRFVLLCPKFSEFQVQRQREGAGAFTWAAPPTAAPSRRFTRMSGLSGPLLGPPCQGFTALPGTLLLPFPAAFSASDSGWS